MIKFFKTLSKELGVLRLASFIILGILSGIFNFIFIKFLTKLVALIIAGKYEKISLQYIVIFISIIGLFILIRKTLSIGIIKLSQKLLWTVRQDILSIIVHARYEKLTKEKIKIHSAIVNDVYTLTQASINIINFFTAIVLCIACAFYLASISFVLFALTSITIAIGVKLHYSGLKKSRKDFERSRSLEEIFLFRFNDILGGIKEIFLEPKKGEAILVKVRTIAEQSTASNIIALSRSLNNQVISQVLLYVLIASILIFFSVILKIKPEAIISYIFTLLYLSGSIETIMALTPNFMQASLASNQLMNLKRELIEEGSIEPTSCHNAGPKDFETIYLNNVKYKYPNIIEPFEIGPVNLEIKRGKIIFVYGGNGSGKTTLINTLVGLLSPSSGVIYLNEKPILQDNRHFYKANFSVVFSDFYLFDEILGVDKVDIGKWEKYIRLFEMENIVSLQGNQLSTVNLSTGQRKRLALIILLLEEKPILVLDEWAADQDPYFKKKFYLEILPLLKQENKTVIAITHDDKYYHCADQIFKMDSGVLIEEFSNAI